MNENLSKFSSIILALLFFSIAIGTVSGIDFRIKKIISTRENKNYIPSELSLKYSGAEISDENHSTKNKMLVANLLLELSRIEGEETKVEVFGQKIDLNQNTSDVKVLINGELSDKSSLLLKNIIEDSEKYIVDFKYDENLLIKKVDIKEE